MASAIQLQFETTDGENMVRLDTEYGVLETYTRGTMEALYVGTDADEAAKSLEMSREDFDALLMSDPV